MISRRLKAVIESYRNPARFAKATGVSVTMVRRVLYGERYFGRNSARKILRVHPQLTEHEIMCGDLPD